MANVTRKYTDEFLEQVKKLASEGRSLREAAELLGLRGAQLKALAGYYGIRFHGRPGQPLTTVIIPDEKVDAVVAGDRRIRQLEDELSALKRKYEASLREDTLANRIIEATLGSIKAMSVVEPVAVLPGSPDHANTQDVVGLCSCLHLGEIVDSEATMGLGRYDPSMAAARLELYIDRVLDLALRHHSGETFEKMWLVDLGDNISGSIHDELRETNAFSLGEQIVVAGQLLALALRDLAKFFPKVTFIGTVGNHARFTQKPTFKDKAKNNGDYVIYHLVKALLADQPNVEVIIPNSPWVTVNIRGHEFFFTHGDAIKMYFQFPYYDAQRYVTQMAQLLVANGEPYPKYWGFGHFHKHDVSQLSYGEWLFTGSFKGPDEYSIGKLRAGTPPTALFFGVHPINGVTFPYPVLLDKADPEIQTRYQLVL